MKYDSICNATRIKKSFGSWENIKKIRLFHKM